MTIIYWTYIEHDFHILYANSIFFKFLYYKFARCIYLILIRVHNKKRRKRKQRFSLVFKIYGCVSLYVWFFCCCHFAFALFCFWIVVVVVIIVIVSIGVVVGAVSAKIQFFRIFSVSLHSVQFVVNYV